MADDRLRQWANVVTAFAQPLTVVAAFSTKPFSEATDKGVGPTLIEPAGYAFAVWGLIYLGAMAYAVYQALPGQRESPLCRHVGWSTASAFLSVVVWLVFARLGWIWGTVLCILWMAASLAGPFLQFVRRRETMTRWDRVFVVFPLSVFAGWISVAVFANAAAALKASGLMDVGLSEEAWTVLMILSAGAFASVITLWSRGNAAYSLTVLWALVAIVVADQTRRPGTAITPAALAVSACLVLSLIAGRGGHWRWPRRSGGHAHLSSA